MKINFKQDHNQPINLFFFHLHTSFEQHQFYPMNKLTLLCAIFFASFLTLQAGNIIDEDEFVITVTDCDEEVGICLGIPASTFSNFQIFQDGQLYSGNLAGCDFDTMILYSYNTLFGMGTLGPYHLDEWTVDGNTFEGQFITINELVDSMNLWDPNGNWVHDPASLTISGGASGTNYSDMTITALLNNTPSIIGLNFGLNAQGMELSFGVGEYELIIIDNLNACSDTVDIIINCIPTPTNFTFTDTIPADVAPYVYCLDTTELTGNIVSFENICPDESGTFVSFFLDQSNYCVKYQGKKCNGDERACIVLCDDLGMCDTTYIEIHVDNSACNFDTEKITDEVLINFSGTACLDTTELPGIITDIQIGCNGGGVDFEIDETNYCVTYTGILPGIDNSCILLIDQFGNVDTTFFCIDVILPEVGTVSEMLPCGTTVTTCLDINELAGSIVSIENVCPELSGESINFIINDLTLCVDGESISQGIDTACIVICDEFAVCDTTYIVFTVFTQCDPCQGQSPPQALDDFVDATINIPVNIEILANDTIPDCAPPSITILDIADGGLGPNNGMTILNIDGTVDYITNQGYCGPDSFTYVLCNTLGCDTANVYLDIDCFDTPDDEILIFDGISPNGDGINDAFTIVNIDQFPNNELRIYNRWGNLVHEEIGYNNTWTGMWEGKNLPDGTYFYFLKLEPSRKREYTGFLQLKR